MPSVPPCASEKVAYTMNYEWKLSIDWEYPKRYVVQHPAKRSNRNKKFQADQLSLH